ncbi:P-loop containing nucleoside triphosphate hydrolase protein [Halteromyces radiatus]|uniref:P-loop containing nucleoside triphosphate hydrolase protein n=1 Tax=Halteromyces radiatus TaxID=101107 RepID=UPI00221F505A|nr:P-loop containing nucleoside triphosphate hydrolase protein [Halteromyces radiatus]KAI8100149.1 P-loop containing nucleoside triphosphate hydrolase protein [Halteromyces radiatus]
MTDYISKCYGDQGERLVQLFQLAFGSNEDDQYTADTILIHGDAGVGKSKCLDILSEEYDLKIWRTTLGDLASDYDGRLALGFDRITWKVMNGTPNIVVLEDVDLFFPRYADTQDNALLPAMERLIHQIQLHRRCLLIATTRNPTCIDLNAKRLFQDIIKLDIPTPNERLVMMDYLTTRCTLIKQPLDIITLSSQAHAFVASNLAQWCKLAEEMAIQESCSEVTKRHFDQTFSQVHVVGHQGTMAEKPDPVRWTDIGGLQEAKDSLEESAVWIYKHADAYQRLGIRPSKGVLLYGPPGTGKTLLAKAVATESSANFLPVSVPDLIKAEVGESEKALANIFQTAIRCSPSVIFLDELEAIFSSRETSGDLGRKLISQFMIEMDHLDKIHQHVILLGATNHLESIDPSILCPGRLDRLVYIGPPNLKERLAILQVLGKKTRLGTTVDLQQTAEKTDGYTGADLKGVLRKAGLLTLKRQQQLGSKSDLWIEQQDIDIALTHVTPSLL